MQILLGLGGNLGDPPQAFNQALAALSECHHAHRWGPRPLDLDLLMAHSLAHRGPRLILPHPLLVRRAFALVPAAELTPDWVHQTAGCTLGELARQALLRAGSEIEPA
jgi:7,8-dihydro-6-hydroxymethylpterin-pyrophosphokinase